MADTSDTPEKQSLKNLEVQKAAEQAEVKNTIDRAKGAEQAEPAGPPEPTAEQIRQFRQEFGDKPGAVHVIGDATGGNWSKRVGAEHHMNVAQELGNEVKSFEDPIHPESTGKMNNVDIVTNDGYAIECKTSWGDQANPSTVNRAYHQAERRFEPNLEGKNYKGVVVVFPDGKLAGEAAHAVENYRDNDSPIHFCEKSQVNQVLQEMRNKK